MKINIMNQRLTTVVTMLTIVAATVAALLVTPGGTAQVEASQRVDARIAGDVLKVKGTKGDDKLTLRLKGGDANVLEVDVGDDGTADFSFDRALFTEIKVNGRRGNDLIRVEEANGLVLTFEEATSLSGGDGNDTILGGSASETMDGGGGDDFIDGNRGADTAFMGAGDDTFRWDPGDASDVVEGGKGSDTLLFNGSNGGETVDLSANGERFIFFRQPGNITMDVEEVETSVFNALGGPDTMTVNDLTGTDVTEVDFLGNLPGGGDILADQVIVNGTAGEGEAEDADEDDDDDDDDEDEDDDDGGNDAIVVTGGAGSVNVTGLSATVAIAGAEAATDLLTVNALGGDDTVDASGLQADAIKQLTVDSGSGDDVILGGRGVDVLMGGAGDDFIDGNQANDVSFMGSGNDTFRWDPGDGSDVVEGEDGSDTLLFNGAAGGETVDLSANGERFTFFRQPGNITMDMNEVETSLFNALGGPDAITVNDLTGTDVTQVDLNLENPTGSGVGDGQADRVTVNGTAGNDAIVVTGSAGIVKVTGLSASVAISSPEAANDLLTVNTLAGDDTVDASGLQADAIKQLTVDGGGGDDLLLGGGGADVQLGGDGDDFIDGNQADDVAFMGAGDDTFRWDPGDASDVVEGEDGSDTLLFNGANVGETADVSANGERFTFFRQPGNITMDMNDVETAAFNALGGTDTITVNDLTGTGVIAVLLNLEGAPIGSGVGDGQADRVIVNGTAGDDDIVVTGSLGIVSAFGLSADVQIFHTEFANDRLDINTLAGNDTVDASGLQADAIKQLTVDGGGGDDLILGGYGADSLIGGGGGDFIDGNQADDVAFMGAGDDTFRWDPGDGSDVVEGEDGDDTLGFNGAGANETVDLSANGERFTFFRQPGNITMDLNDVETAAFNALGGTDTITVNDLTGTGVTAVLLNLEGAPIGSGVGDGQADRVIVNGTAGDDDIVVTGSLGIVSAFGLSADVQIFHTEFANDRLDINTAAGNDAVDTSGLAPGVIQLFVDGVPA